MPKSPSPQSNVPAPASVRPSAAPPPVWLVCTTCKHRYPSLPQFEIHNSKLHGGGAHADADAPAREAKPGRGQVYRYTYGCPHCREIRVDYVYEGREPDTMVCSYCERYSPRPAWTLISRAVATAAPPRPAPPEPHPHERLPHHVCAGGVLRGHYTAAYLRCPGCGDVQCWQLDARGNRVERTCPACGHHTDEPHSVLDYSGVWPLAQIPDMVCE